MLYIFFCGFKVLLPMNITCYYYLKVGLKEAAWSSSILRGALSRVPKTRALKRGLGISSPRKVKNLEANNLTVCIYLQIFQPLIWTERIAVYSTNWVVRQIPEQYRINQSINQSVSQYHLNCLNIILLLYILAFELFFYQQVHKLLLKHVLVICPIIVAVLWIVYICLSYSAKMKYHQKHMPLM